MTRSFNITILLFAFIMFAGSHNSTGQTVSPDACIKEVYGTFVAQLSAAQLSWIKNELGRSEIKKMPVAEAGMQYPLLSSVPLMTKYNPGLKKDDLSHPTAINPLKYAINFYQPNDQAFRIDGTDYVLTVKGKK